MRRASIILGLVASTSLANAAPITLSQLGNVGANGKCLVRPDVGASIYNAIVAARGSNAGGLSDAQVLAHAATRLGFGVSPRGALTLKAANDCTTVFIADEIARQIASLGTKGDSAQIARIRRGVMPLTMYPRADLNAAIWRHQQDEQGVALGSFNLLWYEARTQWAALETVREAFGSQVVSSGTVHDVQVNLDALLLELWRNHFNVNSEKANQYFYGSNGYHARLRAVQGTTFERLLRVVMREPAMLFYLDNRDNRCDPATHRASNQNLARELLELHTLGKRPTAGVYDQSDVEAVAEALCGWNVIPYTVTLPSTASGFVFNSALASTRSVSIMGITYAAEGEARVTKLLNALANHSATRTNVCTKLSERLYAPALVNAARSACTSAWGTGGDLKAMVTKLVTRGAFWQRTNYRKRMRTPFELVVAFVRQQGATAQDLAGATAAENMTEVPFAPANLTPQQAYDRLTALRTKPPFVFVAGLLYRMRLLFGTGRGLVAPPTGYEMDGTYYLSTAYVDAVSRLGLEVATALSALPEEHRTHVTAKASRDALAAKLASMSRADAAEWFLEQQMGMGNVIDGGGSAPVVFNPSHVAIVEAVIANSAWWAYWASSPAAKQPAHTLVGLGLGNAHALWR